MLSIIIVNLKRSGKGGLNISINIKIFLLACPSAWVHVVNSRRLIISNQRNPENIVTLEIIALSVIIIPHYLVTVSERE